MCDIEQRHLWYVRAVTGRVISARVSRTTSSRYALITTFLWRINKHVTNDHVLISDTPVHMIHGI